MTLPERMEPEPSEEQRWCPGTANCIWEAYERHEQDSNVVTMFPCSSLIQLFPPAPGLPAKSGPIS